MNVECNHGLNRCTWEQIINLIRKSNLGDPERKKPESGLYCTINGVRGNLMCVFMGEVGRGEYMFMHPGLENPLFVTAKEAYDEGHFPKEAPWNLEFDVID